MTQIRISGGELRGRRLPVGVGIRPTEGRVREALFSIWSDRLPGARLLDLFAGSGAVGIEALSRGVASVVLVERHAPTAQRLRRTLQGLGLAARSDVQRLDLPRGLGHLALDQTPFELVFADPPYDFADAEPTLAGLAPLLAEGGSLAFEHSSRRPAARSVPGLEWWEDRRYGECTLSFYGRADGSAQPAT